MAQMHLKVYLHVCISYLLKDFVKIKSAFVLTALELGYNVLLSDTDIAFVKNPFPYFADLGSHWDLLFQVRYFPNSNMK